MRHEESEALVRQFYNARFEGNIDEAMAFVNDDVRLHLLGSADHSPFSFNGENIDQFRQALSLLVSQVKFENFQLIDLVVEGDKIAFIWRGDAISLDANKRRTTDLMDFWTVRNGRISSIYQTCDTALAKWLME